MLVISEEGVHGEFNQEFICDRAAVGMYIIL